MPIAPCHSERRKCHRGPQEDAARVFLRQSPIGQPETAAASIPPRVLVAGVAGVAVLYSVRNDQTL
jgi:hypothetical protein